MARVWMLLLMAVGCRPCTAGPEAQPIVQEPAPAPAPGSRVGVPIVVRNGTGEPLRLSVAFGPGTPVGVVDEAGALAPVSLNTPPHACECPCDGPRCECQPMRDVVELAPGGEHRVAWDGTLLRLRPRDGWRCYEREPATAGGHVFRACDEYERRCGVAHVELPRDEPIVIAIGPEALPAADCADRSRLERAARIALAHATLAGVAPEHLAACDARRATCDEPEGEGCRIHVDTSYELWTVKVQVAPADGSQRSFEAAVERAAVGHPARVMVSADTWAMGHGGRLSIAGVTRSRRHTHGGEPARIASAVFEVDNRTGAPMELRARRVEWLVAYSCELPGPSGREPPVAGVVLNGEGSTQPSVRLPTGSSEVTVGFEGMEAYQSHCDRVAARVTFDAGGEELVATAEWRVVRVEPLRR